MEWVLILAAACGWALAIIVLVVIPARGRRVARQASLRLRSHVEPYLMRRASELQLDPRPESTNPMSEPDEILTRVCALADRLTAWERDQVALGDTINIAVSDTMPLKSDNLLDSEEIDE